MQMKDDPTPIDLAWLKKTGGFARDKTLRDEFAGLAMQGIISHILKNESFNGNGSELAYHMADAMLKAREAK